MSGEPPQFNFGGPASTSSSTPSSLLPTSSLSGSTVFGGGSSAQSTGSSLFGSGDTSQPAGGAWTFPGLGASSAAENKSSNGATEGKKPSGGFGGFGGGSGTPSFGNLGGTQTPPKSLFGSTRSSDAGATNAAFGGFSAGGTTTSAPAGSTTPAASGLSFNKPSTTPAGAPPTNLFGGSTGVNTLFGNQDQNKPKTTASAAPAAAAPPTVTASSLFGGDKAKQQVSTFNWGKPVETTQSTNPPSSIGTEAQKPLFSGLGQNNSASPSTQPQKPLFGGLGQNTPSTSAPATASATPSLFSPLPPASAGQDKSKGLQFPSINPSTTQAATSDASKSKSFFDGAKSQTTPSTSAPAFGNLFGNTPTTASAAPSANVFNLGISAPATTATQTPASSTAATTIASTTAPSSSLFKVPDKPASATANSALQPTTTTTSGPTGAPTTSTSGSANDLGKSVLGASTTGPNPPAQSRLRNKTMDEILTRWTSDLTKYTKEFQSHAETVAHWDQLLVENMSKISKLYISAVNAEKQTASVEMQLSAVESQQNELDCWLSKYEGEVDEMLAKEGGTQGMELGGPDQERERTYKLAEQLGERLEEMGRDLGNMIDEINAANSGLSKVTNTDEPITQIVRILNSHLSQLQAIDQGTLVLQAKVAAAQKASQGLGFPGLNGSNGTAGTGGSGGAVDGFYRSYMGRR